MENKEKNKIQKMISSLENNPILQQKLDKSKEIYDKISSKVDILLKKKSI